MPDKPGISQQETLAKKLPAGTKESIMQDKRANPEQEAFAKKLMDFSETLNEKERASLLLTLANAQGMTQGMARPDVRFFRGAVMSW